MKFRILETMDDFKMAYPIMKELRDHLDENSFLRILSDAQAQSAYVLIGAMSGPACVGLMGYRILTDFVHGRHLYIDDLVIAKDCRCKGLGSLFLERAKAIASLSNCDRLRLCTGTQNQRGKKFYERNGWRLKAVVYKIDSKP